jgi:hypothetical protein
MPIQLPVWESGPGPPQWSELIPQEGVIDAEAELKGGNLATTFLRICGVRERWTEHPEVKTSEGRWTSSHAEMRANVEAMIAAIRRQAAETERFWESYRRGVVAVRRFLGV